MTIRSFLRLSAHIQMLPVLESGEETTLVGGQAVMEGVMMRAPHSYCVAVRKPNGEIVTEESPLPRVSEKYPIFKLPILRGLGTLGQAMYAGREGAAVFGERRAGEEDRQSRREARRAVRLDDGRAAWRFHCSSSCSCTSSCRCCWPPNSARLSPRCTAASPST